MEWGLFLPLFVHSISFYVLCCTTLRKMIVLRDNSYTGKWQNSRLSVIITNALWSLKQTWDKILKNFEMSKFWSYWYWFWYWKLQFQNIDFDIEIEICISKILILILILKFLGLLILILVLILKKMGLILKIWVVRERLVPPGPWVFW